MLCCMEFVVALHPGRSNVAVDELLARACRGSQLLPMYPEATDIDGRRWYLVRCDDPTLIPALLAQLQRHADVDAAYLKPAGAAPR